MMEDINGNIPLFKKLDRIIFEQIDKFKTTPNYSLIHDFYNSLEEEQQKLAKAIIILLLFLVPLMGMGFILWQNDNLREDLGLRTSIISKANEIIGQNQGLREVSPQVLSPNPIDSSSMMTSRLSNLLSGAGIDLSKIQVEDFSSDPVSSSILKSKATFKFKNFSTDELMNTLTILIQREKFRIQSIDVTRSTDSELLVGNFVAIHYSTVTPGEESE